MTTAAAALILLDLAELAAVAVWAISAQRAHPLRPRGLALRRGLAWVALATATAIATESMLAAHHRAAPIGIPTLTVALTLAGAALIAAATGLVPNLRRSGSTLTTLGTAACAASILTLFYVPVFAIWPVATFPLAIVVARLARLPRRWRPSARRGLVAVTTISLVASFLMHAAPTSLEIAGTQQHTFTISAPAARRGLVEDLSSGVLTNAEHTAQRSITLSLTGIFEASRPNFHQVVRVSIRLAARATTRLVIDAAGIPQPNGALALVHSHIQLETPRRFLRGAGHLTTFAPDALIGRLTIDGHAWSILVSLEPIGDATTRATATLWPAVGLHLF